MGTCKCLHIYFYLYVTLWQVQTLTSSDESPGITEICNAVAPVTPVSPIALNLHSFDGLANLTSDDDGDAPGAW